VEWLPRGTSVLGGVLLSGQGVGRGHGRVTGAAKLGAPFREDLLPVRDFQVNQVRAALICAVLLAGPAVPSPAQAGPSTASVFYRIRPGAMVRARLGPDQAITGKYFPIGDGALGITVDRGTTDTLRLDQLSELAVRGRHTKTGAIIGGAAGVAFGTFIGIIITATCETNDCNGVGPYFLTVPLFGSGGALLGAAVGAAIPKWRKVFP
jgi:hypothetical protein